MSRIILQYGKLRLFSCPNFGMMTILQKSSFPTRFDLEETQLGRPSPGRLLLASTFCLTTPDLAL